MRPFFGQARPKAPTKLLRSLTRPRIGTVRSGRKLTACETRTGNPARG